MIDANRLFKELAEEILADEKKAADAKAAAEQAKQDAIEQRRMDFHSHPIIYDFLLGLDEMYAQFPEIDLKPIKYFGALIEKDESSIDFDEDIIASEKTNIHEHGYGQNPLVISFTNDQVLLGFGDDGNFAAFDYKGDDAVSASAILKVVFKLAHKDGKIDLKSIVDKPSPGGSPDGAAPQ